MLQIFLVCLQSFKNIEFLYLTFCFECLNRRMDGSGVARLFNLNCIMV